MGSTNQHGYTKIRMQSEAVSDAVPITTLVVPDDSLILEGADEAHLTGLGATWVELAVSTFTDIADAITDIGATPATLVIDSTEAVSTAIVVPATMTLRIAKGAKLTKSGSGTIEFQGLGLDNPDHKQAIFSGFAAGDITWTGTVYPHVLSTEWWDTANVSLQDRYNRADLAVAGKYAEIYAYPRTLTSATAIIGEEHHLKITAGEYPNTVATYGGSNWAPFLMKNNSSITGEPGNIIYESATNGNGWLIYGWHTRSGGGETAGYQENVHVRGINYVSSSLTMTDTTGGSSAIQLGNVINGSVKECTFYKTKNYAVLVGLYGTDGNHARNFVVENCRFYSVGTQVLAVINAIGCTLKGNYFDQHDTPGTSSYAVIDIEPNAADDRVEDLEIDDNTIDARDVADHSKYVYAGIAIQAALEGSIKNIRVTRNRIYGAEISAGGTILPLANGIICWGVWGADFFDNTIRSAFQRAFIFTQNRNIRFQMANTMQCTDVTGDNYALLVEACSDSDFKHLTFRESVNTSRQSTGIYESELWHPITSSGSNANADHTVGLFKFFYDFYVGQQVRVNNVDLTVSTFNDINQLGLSASIGTLIKKTFTSADVDTTANTIAYTAHPYNTGAQVWLWNDTNTLPAPLTNSTLLQPYFAINAGANLLKIALTYADALAGTAVNLTTGGTGNHYLSAVMATKFSNNLYEDCDCPDGISIQPNSELILNTRDYVIPAIPDGSIVFEKLEDVLPNRILGTTATGGIVDPVTWQNIVGVTQSGADNKLTKTTADGWDAGASSVETIVGDGYLEFTVTETTEDRMCGLSETDPNQDYTSIEYAFQVNGTALNIFESGANKGAFGTVVADTTVLRIERVGTLISYYKDGVWIYDSATATSDPLRVDTSLNTTGATIGGVILGGLPGSVEALTAAQVLTLLNASGVISGDYGSSDGSLPIGDEGRLYLNTNASSLRFFLFNDGAFREIFQSGISLLNLATSGNVTGLLPFANIDQTAALNDQTGTSYTLVAGDKGKVVTLNNASAITLTVPSGLGVGFNCMVIQKGAGQVTFTASGTTIRQRQTHTKTAGQYAACSLVAHVANDFILGGDTAA